MFMVDHVHEHHDDSSAGLLAVVVILVAVVIIGAIYLLQGNAGTGSNDIDVTLPGGGGGGIEEPAPITPVE